MTEDTLLLRQIHPSFVQLGRVTSQAFRPTPKDAKQLSVYDGDRIEAHVAWQHYTSTLGLASYGVMAVTFAECSRQGLPAFSDPEPFPEHAVIDFRDLSDREIEKKSKMLKRNAEVRGWLHM